MIGQISIYDLFQEPKEPIEPLLEAGQTIYKVNLDVIRSGTISSKWKCSGEYGYGLDYAIGHDCTWDKEVGQNVFTELSQAQELTDKMKAKIIVIRASDMAITSQRTWGYVRDCDGWFMTATLATVNENMVYAKHWMCYPFMYIFQNSKDAEACYKKCLKKITQDEYNTWPYKEMPEQIPLEDMYHCEDNRYSGWEYAERNGKPYGYGGNYTDKTF